MMLSLALPPEAADREVEGIMNLARLDKGRPGMRQLDDSLFVQTPASMRKIDGGERRERIGRREKMGRETRRYGVLLVPSHPRNCSTDSQIPGTACTARPTTAHRCEDLLTLVLP